MVGKQYLYDLCDFTANSNHDLKKHIETIHSSSTYVCSFETSSREALNKHSNVHNITKDNTNRDKEIKLIKSCTICDFVPKRKVGLKYHTLSKHDKVTVIECE